MLETLCVLATAGSALKITGWIFLGIIAFYATIMAVSHYGGLEGIVKFFGTCWVLFWIAIVFGIVFLAVLGIQSLVGV